MGRIVIAVYKPKSDKEKDLLEVVKDHTPVLRSRDLIIERNAIVMKAEDGTILEVFEWKSKEAIDRAHNDPFVLALWKRFENSSEFVSLSKLEESNLIFAEFEPVEFS